MKQEDAIIKLKDIEGFSTRLEFAGFILFSFGAMMMLACLVIPLAILTNDLQLSSIARKIHWSTPYGGLALFVVGCVLLYMNRKKLKRRKREKA